MLPLLAPPLEPRPIRLEIGSDPILKHQIFIIAESPPDDLSAMNIKVDIKIPEQPSFVISRTKKVLSQLCVKRWLKMTYCSDLDVIVIMILYEVRASKKRREWLDAICRLIIWTTLSSETSIPRANLTSTSPSNTTAAVSYIPTRTLQAQSDFLLLLQRHCTKRTRYLTRWEHLWGSYCCTECFGHIPGRR